MIDNSRLTSFERDVLARALSAHVELCTRARRRTRSVTRRADLDWQMFVASSLLLEIAPDAHPT